MRGFKKGLSGNDDKPASPTDDASKPSPNLRDDSRKD
jgi:hypothetical protein